MLVRADPGTEKYVSWAKKKAAQLGALARELGLHTLHRSFDLGDAKVFLIARAEGHHVVRIEGTQVLESLAILRANASGKHEFWGLAKGPTGLYAPAKFTDTTLPKFPWPAPLTAQNINDLFTTHEDAKYAATAELQRLGATYIARAIRPPAVSGEAHVLADPVPRFSAERYIRDDGVDLRLQKIGLTSAAGKEFPLAPLATWRVAADAAFPAGSGWTQVKEDVVISPNHTLALQRQYAKSNVSEESGTYLSRYSIDADTVPAGGSGFTNLHTLSIADFTTFFVGGGVGVIQGTFAMRSQVGYNSRAQLVATAPALTPITVGTHGPSTRAPTPFNAPTSPKVPGSSETTFGFGNAWPQKVELYLDGASVQTLHDDNISGLKEYMFCPFATSVTIEGDEYWFVNATDPKASLTPDGSGGYDNGTFTTYTYRRWVFKNKALVSSSSTARVYNGLTTDADPTTNPWDDTTSAFVYIPTGGMRVAGVDWFCGYRAEQLFTPFNTMSTGAAPSKVMNYRVAPALFRADLSEVHAYAPLVDDHAAAGTFGTKLQTAYTDDVNQPIGRVRLAKYKGTPFLVFLDIQALTTVAYGVAVVAPAMAPVQITSATAGTSSVTDWIPRTIACI